MSSFFHKQTSNVVFTDFLTMFVEQNSTFGAFIKGWGGFIEMIYGGSSSSVVAQGGSLPAREGAFLTKTSGGFSTQSRKPRLMAGVSVLISAAFTVDA